MSTRSLSLQRDPVFASAREWELVDISTVDHVCGINGGTAMAIYCEVADETLTVDTTRMTAQATPVLAKGVNAFEVTRVDRAATTLTGNVYLLAW